MYLLDSNILIYSAKAECAFLRSYITMDNVPAAVSVATVIEVLGFYRLSDNDKRYFEACIELLEVIEVTYDICQKAVELRQDKKLSLGDAIIAATALVYDYTLVTRNIADFEHMNSLRLLNPFQN